MLGCSERFLACSVWLLTDYGWVLTDFTNQFNSDSQALDLIKYQLVWISGTVCQFFLRTKNTLE